MLYSDASVYNNGQIGNQKCYYAVVLEDGTEDGLLLKHVGPWEASVNEGEYKGVMAALRWLHDADLDRSAVIITDSKLVWGHVMDGWRCNWRFVAYRNRVQWLLEATGATLIWKPRGENKAGHFFERVVEHRRKERYRRKGEARRAKRKRVRTWTFDNPEVSGYAGGRGLNGSVGLPVE